MFRRIAATGFVSTGAALAVGFLAGSLTPSAPTVEAHPVLPPAPVAHPAPTDSFGPHVEPGRVHWHPSLEAACAAAKQSRKPVLVFHMMGQLDRQFC